MWLGSAGCDRGHALIEYENRQMYGHLEPMGPYYCEVLVVCFWVIYTLCIIHVWWDMEWLYLGLLLPFCMIISKSQLHQMGEFLVPHIYN